MPQAPRNKRRISASVVCWVAVAIVVLWLICATGYYFRQSRHYYNELIKTQERCNGSSSARVGWRCYCMYVKFLPVNKLERQHLQTLRVCSENAGRR